MRDFEQAIEARHHALDGIRAGQSGTVLRSWLPLETRRFEAKLAEADESVIQE